MPILAMRCAAAACVPAKLQPPQRAHGQLWAGTHARLVCAGLHHALHGRSCLGVEPLQLVLELVPVAQAAAAQTDDPGHAARPQISPGTCAQERRRCRCKPQLAQQAAPRLRMTASTPPLKGWAKRLAYHSAQDQDLSSPGARPGRPARSPCTCEQAGRARSLMRGAVQLQDVPSATLHVQPVDVLGDDLPHPAPGLHNTLQGSRWRAGQVCSAGRHTGRPHLQAGQGLMGCIGPDVAVLVPPGKGAGPVARLGLWVGHELQRGPFRLLVSCGREGSAGPAGTRACWCVMGLKPELYAPAGPL